MNKLYILISLLLPISVASLAMEAPEKEKETEKIRTSRTVRLSAEEAQKIILGYHCCRWSDRKAIAL